MEEKRSKDSDNKSGQENLIQGRMFETTSTSGARAPLLVQSDKTVYVRFKVVQDDGKVSFSKINLVTMCQLQTMTAAGWRVGTCITNPDGTQLLELVNG